MSALQSRLDTTPPSPTQLGSKAADFRRMMLDPEILVVPSAYDALSAKVIQQTGFKAVHMTGSGSSASILGYPDLGFTAISEMAEHAKNIVLAVDLPVICDADAGFGNAMNTWRTMREYEQAGIVGFHLEDQTHPKRCGHLEGKSLISTEEMVGKIEALVEARVDPNFTIIARTDAREALGVDEALRRSREYVAAGADCIFFEAPRSVDELKLVRDSLDAPLLANMVEGGKTPFLTYKELEAIGYNLVIYPLTGWMAAASVLTQLFAELRDRGTTQEFWARKGLGMSFEELFEVFEYPRIEALAERFVRE
ncbi:MAG: carboxyvinyl-carboxyphosphonate phosphorylmutase [Nocardioides sp.]